MSHDSNTSAMKSSWCDFLDIYEAVFFKPICPFEGQTPCLAQANIPKSFPPSPKTQKSSEVKFNSEHICDNPNDLSCSGLN